MVEEKSINTEIFGVSLISDLHTSHDLATITANSFRSSAVETSTLFKLHPEFLFNLPVDIITIDVPEFEQEFRFCLVYVFRGLAKNQTFLLITKTSETLPVLSLQGIFPAFNWAEREVWDFFGIGFVNHTDLRRILTDYGFSGFPLRKDFPLTGYGEVYFSDSSKAIEYRPVELAQAFRVFRRTRVWKDES